MANGSASPTTDCIASVVSLGVHVIGRKRQVDCDGQKAGSKDALIGPLGGPSSYRPLSGRYLIQSISHLWPAAVPGPSIRDCKVELGRIDRCVLRYFCSQEYLRVECVSESLCQLL